jgi:hypothetical protein
VFEIAVRGTARLRERGWSPGFRRLTSGNRLLDRPVRDDEPMTLCRMT